MRRLGLGLLLLELAQAGLRAQTSGAPTPAPVPSLAPPAAGGTVQMALYILLLLALFAAGAWILRYGWPAFQGATRTERRLHIRETRSLGGRQFLIVAEYEGRKMLLGVCPGRIDHLCELPASAAEPEFPKIGPETEKAS